MMRYVRLEDVYYGSTTMKVRWREGRLSEKFNCDKDPIKLQLIRCGTPMQTLLSV